MTKEEKARLWQERFADWKRGGLSQREYCAQHDLKFSTFSFWRTKLKDRRPGGKLIPVSLGHPSSGVVVYAGGIRMEVPVSALSEALPLIWKLTQERPSC